MVEILHRETCQVIEINGAAYLPIPKNWRGQTNIKPGDTVTRAILRGKEGIHIGAWNHNDQPNPDENELKL